MTECILFSHNKINKIITKEYLGINLCIHNKYNNNYISNIKQANKIIKCRIIVTHYA